MSGPKQLVHRKRHGSHQKQTKHFLKVYWPYLPLAVMTLVIGVAWLWPHNRGTTLVWSAPAPWQTTARVTTDISSVSSNWPLVSHLLTGLTGFLLAVLLIRHGLTLRRYWRQGERFVRHHGWLDVYVFASLVLLISLGHALGY